MDAADGATETEAGPSSPAPRQRPPRTAPSGTRPETRPIIRRALVGQGVSLDISLDGARYVLPHDDLDAWAREHTTALESASWKVKGLYSWPSASRAMMQFLQSYAVTD